MKIILSLLLFFSALQVQANDTLTRAQVYNFNVGDTFDYKIAWYEAQYNPNSLLSDTGYMRKVIEGLYYSADNDTLFVVEYTHYSSSYFFNGDTVHYISDFEDTLRVDGLNEFVSYGFDSAMGAYSFSFQYYQDTAYNGRLVNVYQQNIEMGALYYWCYGYGLGRIAAGWGYFDGCCSSEQYDTTLIYYSKGAETWGTPFYNLPTGITTITVQQKDIYLFPSINSGRFKIKIVNDNSTTYQLTIYDVTGREIKWAALNTNITDVDIPGASRGMYLWKVTAQGAVLQSGKMVVE